MWDWKPGRFRVKRSIPLRVPDIILRSSAFVVTIANEDWNVVEHDIWASGFFVGIPCKTRPPYSFFYFVTAYHAVRDLKGQVGIRINLRDGRPAIGGGIERWYTHPTDPNADVAVTPFRNNADFDTLFIPSDVFTTREIMQEKEIGIGDEVFFPGLFTYTQGEDRRNHPIVRYGNIAMMPSDPVPTESGLMDAYLIEARSIGGSSGSPVFARRTACLIWNDEPKKENWRAIHGLTGDVHLIGMIHGHWDIKESDINQPHPEADRRQGVNLGIAIVVTADKILETLNQPELVEMREKEESEFAAKYSSTPD